MSRHHPAGRRARSKRHGSEERTPMLVWILLVFAVTGVGAFVWIVIQHDRATTFAAAFTQVDVPEELTKWDDRWPSLPSLETARLARPVETVRAAYAFAARHADMLQHIPCYCGCERMGHRSNAYCYLKGGIGGERPAWDTHSYHCSVCLDVTREVMQLHAAGKSLSAIRDAIDARYVPIYGNGTPTPRPSGD